MIKKINGRREKDVLTSIAYGEDGFASFNGVGGYRLGEIGCNFFIKEGSTHSLF